MEILDTPLNSLIFFHVLIYNGIILTSSLLVLSEAELELEVEEFVDTFETSDILTVDDSLQIPASFLQSRSINFQVVRMARMKTTGRKRTDGKGTFFYRINFQRCCV